MNRIAFSVVLVGVGVTTGLLVSSGLAEPTAVVRGPNPENLTALRKERRDTLRDAADVAMALYRKARIEQGPVLRIINTLLNAELDLAPDRAARIALRERTIKQLKSIEELAVTQKEAARGTQMEILEAQADRLQAEIDLLLEKGDGK
jgi:hypothetical protein